MSNVNSILSITFLLILIPIIFTITFLFFSTSQTQNYNLQLEKIENHQFQEKFNSFLISDEKYFRGPISDLLFFYFKEKSDSINTIYGKLNSSLILKENLDFLYGENNYYLQTKLDIPKVEINLLYDDGEYMKQISSKNKFNLVIKNLIDSFNNSKIPISFKINILSKSTNSPECLNFVSNNISCKTYSSTGIYDFDKVSFPDPIFKYSSINSSEIPSSRSDHSNYYKLNDWASFLAWAYQKEISNNFYSQISLMLLFTDVVNLGGAVTESFYPNKILNLIPCDKLSGVYKDNCIALEKMKQIGYESYLYYCKNNSDFYESDMAVNRTRDFFNNTKGIYFFPLIVRNNNLSVDFWANTYIMDNSPQRYTLTTELYGGNESTACGKNGCIGCFENSTNRIFHPETRAKHIEQLNRLVDVMPGSSLINFDSNTNLTQIINNTLSNVLADFNFEIGTKQINKNSKKYKKDVILSVGSENLVMHIYLEVYDNPYNFTGNLSFKPIVNEINTNYLIISHNQPITNLKIGSNQATNINSIEEISNILYKYNITFTTPIPTTPFDLNYTDQEGIHIITIT